MISRLPKLKHLDDKVIDLDERNEATRMYGTPRKKKSNGKFQPEIERFRGIRLNDFSTTPSSSTSTAVEAFEDIDLANENVTGIAEQESSSTETIYYTFEEHVQFLVEKFSEKFNEWKESFRTPRNNI